MEIGYPFHIAGRGRTAEASTDAHVRQMIEQILFTSPGERVNRPDFGTGLRQLLFGPNSPELAAAAEFTVRGALQRWLGEVIEVEEVQIESHDSLLRVTIRYLLRRSGERLIDQFVHEV